MVFNKIDLYTFIGKDDDDLTPVSRENLTLDDLRRSWMAGEGQQHPVFISAKNQDNLEELKKLLYEEVRKIAAQRYPYNDFLYETDGQVM